MLVLIVDQSLSSVNTSNYTRVPEEETTPSTRRRHTRGLHTHSVRPAAAAAAAPQLRTLTTLYLRYTFCSALLPRLCATLPCRRQLSFECRRANCVPSRLTSLWQHEGISRIAVELSWTSRSQHVPKDDFGHFRSSQRHGMTSYWCSAVTLEGLGGTVGDL